jgi:hypothetical protein
MAIYKLIGLGIFEAHQETKYGKFIGWFMSL